MKRKTPLTVAACQLPDIQADIDEALNVISKYGKEAERRKAKVVCFPECYLQGYIVNHYTKALAIDLNSQSFREILSQLSDIKPILIIGLIECDSKEVYNTAVVIKKGQLLGRYRKVNLLKGEQGVFTSGNSYPIFEVDGIKFGINICYDLNFPDSTKAVAEQDAQLLFCPSNNMMRYQSADYWKDKHNEIRAERAKEGNIHIISSDVTGGRAGRISYGPTALIDNTGIVVEQVVLEQEGLLVETIEV